MPGIFLGRGMGGLMGGGGISLPTNWWLGGGTIDAANVIEHPENIVQRTTYTGAALNTAWTISLRCNLAALPTSTAIAFDSQNGRFIIGLNIPENGFHDATAWRNITLFATGDHTYMLESDGTNIQAYRDNVAVGTAYASPVNISATTTTRWGSRYADGGGSTWYDWPVVIRAGHIANIALGATKRAGLHATMGIGIP